MESLYLDSQSEIINLNTTPYGPDTKVIVSKRGIWTTIADINLKGLDVVWKNLSPETMGILNGVCSK